MSRILFTLGRFAARRPLVTIASWLVVSVAVIGASATFGSALDDSFGVPGSDSDRAIQLLDRAGAEQSGLTAQVVMTPRDGGMTFDAATSLAAAEAVRTRLAALPNVLSASAPTDGRSPDGRVAIVRVQYPPMDALDASDLTRLKDAIAQARSAAPGQTLQIEAGGDLFFAFEQPEGALGELAGIVVALMILLVAFGSLIAAGLPIVLALFGLALGVAALPLVGHFVDIPSWAPIMAAMVGLGVGIDYALLLVSRHREHLAHGMATHESIGLSVATAGRSVVFAGGTVLVAILGLAVAGLPFVTGAGIAISIVVLVMVSASVTLLPALLGLAGPWIDRLSVHRRTPARAPARWERWGTHITTHARAYAVGATVLLVALSAPVLALRLGTPDDGTLPQSRTERRAYDLVASGFGPGTNGPLLVAVDTAGDPGVVARLRAALQADRGIAAVQPAVSDARSGVASVVAVPTTAPQAAATRDTLARVRSELIPTALDGSPARAYVGGQTAVFADASAQVSDRLPAFIAAVVGLSVLLLMVLFRSILVPLKAAAMNLLSVGAAYGVMVMVFQWGWGASLIGVESTVPIVSFIPLFMFAIVFGLSMDYEVFLLSRIRERYLATGDNDDAVATGLAVMRVPTALKWTTRTTSGTSS